MITPNDALQFIKDHHNGEIPYMFGKNEYARWMAEFANHTVTKHLHKLGVMQAEGSAVSDGAAVGQRSAGTNAEAVAFGCVSSDSLVYGKPCKEWCGNMYCKREAPSGGHL